MIASIISLFSKKENPLKDKWSFFVIPISVLMVTSSLYQTFSQINKELIEWNISLTWIGLLNWIPHIILFVGCQKYIITSIDRKRCVIALILGSIPILFSCFSQSFLNWHGPFRTLFGLIVWYQKPLDGFTGITGLFSNPNYLGAWLNII